MEWNKLGSFITELISREEHYYAMDSMQKKLV